MMTVLQELKKVSKEKGPTVAYLSPSEYKELIAEASEEEVIEIMETHSLYEIGLCPCGEDEIVVNVELV